MLPEDPHVAPLSGAVWERRYSGSASFLDCPGGDVDTRVLLALAQEARPQPGLESYGAEPSCRADLFLLLLLLSVWLRQDGAETLSASGHMITRIVSYELLKRGR